ncbi:ATP-binding cassette domain-containing protein [Desulfohalovibrio reitneri]|uniref:ATP-binding cassette domain-containing protein n=1 Tax=Desulfohalovibrio reitneri TaxID=1307759 RepID=UPI0009DD8591|nr:ATP-binding cassette domain-containing protein [Desulfohalovibrio reitneri]
MAEPLIQFKGLTKSFGSNPVLDRVDLRMYQGEVTSIIGKSGVGKSVMIKHIVGLLEPDGGEILFKGRDIRSMDSAERHDFKSRVSYMFQNNALFDSMTVFENIALPLREKTKMAKGEIEKKVGDMIATLELGEVGGKYPSQLSGGMQKRVALARALIKNPEIVLFDEPTTGLDPLRKNAVLAMVARYQRQFGFTAIMVSHDVPDVFYVSNRIAILDQGRILFEGSPLELERSGNEVAAEFMGSLESLENELLGMEDKPRLADRFKEKADEWGLDCSLLYARVEGMAELRRTAGELAAHRLLDRILDAVRRRAGDRFLAGRWGADELVCLLPGDTADGVIEAMPDELAAEEIFSGRHALAECASFRVLAGAAARAGDEPVGKLVERAAGDLREVAGEDCAKEDAT